MRVSVGSLVIVAGVCGFLSFAFLATSLGTEYWYIIEMNPTNTSDLEDMSSHSGLWSINEGGKMNAGAIDSFKADRSRYSEAELHMLGGICGLVSSLARSPVLLTSSAFYFFISSKSRFTTFIGGAAVGGGLLTLCGVSLYIIYSYKALAETERLVGPEGLAHVHTSFGWSLGMAWLSYGLELLTGALLLGAAQMAKAQHSRPSWPDTSLDCGSNTARKGIELY
ncbi:hypothetical protein F2P81_022126 [Scophthalmus maximus]|uniref:Transmembrane protein 235-like n=1 Tax=Scophthalmus maximus TaxID=52904 RepID=A0A6A4RYX0_SCOMX|nr:hypothetical protein F2P81_022126 [Scophthalmus maximus]